MTTAAKIITRAASLGIPAKLWQEIVEENPFR